MKAIQVTMDEGLLAALDADEEVERLGRSEVMRRAVAAYLRARRARAVHEEYRQGYGQASSGLGAEFAGWEDEGQWSRD